MYGIDAFPFQQVLYVATGVVVAEQAAFQSEPKVVGRIDEEVVL